MGDPWKGISYLPEDCIAYKDGFRYGAYEIKNGSTHVVEFFKTKDEIQQFVNRHPEFGKGAKDHEKT